MTTARETTGRRRRRQRDHGWLALGAWLIICLGVFIWLATYYRSVVEWVGEWQFYWFGRYFPSATITLAVLILTVPLAAIGAILRHRRRRREEKLIGEGAPIDPLRRVIRSARRGNRFFGTLSLVLFALALLAFVLTLGMPTDAGPVMVIPLDRPADFAEGHARFDGEARLGPIARIDENVGFARRTMWMAPIEGAGGADGRGYFVEMLPDRTGQRFHRLETGVLVRHGVPPELQILFRRIGVPVSDESYLLMRDAARPRWRLTALAVQAAIVSLVSLLIALVFRRQGRRLRKIARERRDEAAADKADTADGEAVAGAGSPAVTAPGATVP